MGARLFKNWQGIFTQVQGALRRRGRSAQDADDLVQEAWVRLVRYEDEGGAVDKPEAFMMRVAMNLSVDAHRSRVAHGEEVMIEDVLLIDTAPSVEETVLGRERLARLSVGLSRLTEKTRTIFLSHRIDGLTYGEIAQRHGISVATVHQHVAKATLQLTTWMERW